MKNIYVQHGDVILEKVDTIPGNAKSILVVDGFIVEKGEGVHTHTLRSKKVSFKEDISALELNSMADKVEIYELFGLMYIKVKEAIDLDHEEHGTQTLEPGIYKKNIEREFDYEKSIERKVKD
ncbi:MAG: hypothetical protein LHV68_04250 [Elusimicrobia bacterium]|nr:hypothetical protein [Candidatus Liberimonas magnetica]